MKKDDELFTFVVVLLFVGLLLFGAIQWNRMSQAPQIKVGEVSMEVLRE